MCLWWLVALITTPVIVSAQDGGQADEVLGPTRPLIVLPESAEKVQGFTLQLQVAQQTFAGYVPVKMTFQATTRLPADRRLLVRFRCEPQLETPPQNGLVVDVPLTVPQGTTTQSFVRYLPKWSAGQAITVLVMEEGRSLPGYGTFFGGENLNPTGFARAQSGIQSRRMLLFDEHQLNWLFLSADERANAESLPELFALLNFARPSDAFPAAIQVGSDEQRVGMWNELMKGSFLHAIGQRELPSDWRGFQRYDAMVMDLDGMRALQSRPAALESLRQWVLIGGTVIVYNAASVDEVANGFQCTSMSVDKTDKAFASVVEQRLANWGQSLSNLQATIANQEELRSELDEQIRSLTAEVGADPESSDDPAGVPADLPATASLSSQSQGGMLFGESKTDQLAALKQRREEVEAILNSARERLAEIEPVLAVPVTTWQQQIQVRGAGAGLVIAISPLEDAETPTLAHWGIVASLLDHRASPTLRRGVDPLMGDGRFARWTIPGVAQPPVYTFMGLLTAFVVLVGPVAYRRTAKIGRSYWMFAIAPVLALLTTIAMFAYGILADGFGTTVRVRQLTWVDGKSGDAGERVRSTYFAGVRPSEGLRFAGDAELMVYPEGTGQSWEDLDRLEPATMGRVRVDEQSQQLDASFLPSRQQRQFVVHQPREEIGFLQLVPDPKGVEAPEVVSGFNFPLRQGVLRDDQSRYWVIDNLGPEEVKRSRPLTTRDASRLLGQLYNDHRPLSEVRESRTRNRRYDREIFDVIADINRTLESKVSLTDGLFEYWLQQNLQTNGEIPDGHFVAIADISRDVIAVEGSEVRSSIRYVFGTLR